MITAGKRLLLLPFHLTGEKLSKHGLHSIFKIEQQGRTSWEVLKTLLQIMSQTLWQLGCMENDLINSGVL